MIIGGRAHDFGKLPVAQLAAKVSKQGYSYVQLALSKAIYGIDCSFGKLSPGLGNYIRDSFKKENVQIAVLGCYINHIHPDIQKRRVEIDRFKEHIRFARDFGCSIVGTETGTLKVDGLSDYDNESESAFETLIESLKELICEAEKFGVIVGIEGGKNEVVSTPQRMRRVLDLIPSNNLQVIYDPTNYISILNFKDQNDLIKDAFNLFGDRMVILHAKDFVVCDNKINIVAAGMGSLNYELILKLIKQRKPFINILLEDIKEVDMDGSIKFIEQLYNRV
ncbi:sugar phosphate isomerase/epimerase family protein [Clostridium estertheticum]|uniref:sugar phosphate isomerase/epimerase family protein n=1 Tax=Clostridium estertheticum TaxID=238834 RepID=UPI00209BA893|nr:sugar phosphate isomerase/epimerase family protein [Clostridium estertheticum]